MAATLTAVACPALGIGGTASGTADASLAALFLTVNIQPGQADDHGHDRDDDDTFPHIVYSLKLNDSQRPVFWFRFSAFFQPLSDGRKVL